MGQRCANALYAPCQVKVGSKILNDGGQSMNNNSLFTETSRVFLEPEDYCEEDEIDCEP